MCKFTPYFHVKADQVAGWAHRQTLLSYCIGTVKASTESLRPTSVVDARLSAVDEKLNAGPSRIDRDRRDRGWREAEVLVSFPLELVGQAHI